MTGMDIAIEYSRLANKYMFVANVAGTLGYSGDAEALAGSYTSVIGELSISQKQIAEEFKNWYRTSREDGEERWKKLMKLCFNRPSEEMVWQEMQSDPIDGELLPKVFGAMDVPFAVLWNRYEMQLKEMRAIARNDLSNRTDSFRKIWKLLEVFYGRPAVNQIAIQLIVHPSPAGYAGKAIDGNTISVAMPSLAEESAKNFFWLLFLHEAIHIQFEPREYKAWLKEFADRQPQTELSKKLIPKSVLREVITSAFAPRGYLAEQFFGINLEKMFQENYKDPKMPNRPLSGHFLNLKCLAAIRLHNAVAAYVAQRKKIDEAFLAKAWDVILEYEKAAHGGERP